MEPIYQQSFKIDDVLADRFGRLKSSAVLMLIQEASCHHSELMSLDYDTLDGQDLFWAISRHRVQITRLPTLGETLRVETWPMPTTRVAYPRSVVAYDENGQECFRSVSLWVMMDKKSRAMVVPRKSGIILAGTTRGGELTIPSSLTPALSRNLGHRTVCFTDLDRNGHMNNTRCMDWIADLLPSGFHRDHTLKELTTCYLNEAREGDSLELHWDFLQEDIAQVDAYRREDPDHESRIFSVRIQFT